MLPRKLDLFLILFLNIIKSRGRGMEGKIVGGEYTDVDRHPHTGYIFEECEGPNKDKMEFTCGGTIVNDMIIITAAHCVKLCKAAYNISVIFGAADLLMETKTIRQVRQFIMHEDFDEDDMSNDVALLLMKEGIPFGRTIKRIIIMPYFFDDMEAEVAGWGLVDEQGTLSSKLKSLRVKVFTTNACRQLLYPNSVLPGTFCAASGTKIDYVLFGDSGSGLVTKDYQLIGLVSYRLSDLGEIGIYTNVSYYYDWISDHTPELYCPALRAGSMVRSNRQGSFVTTTADPITTDGQKYIVF